MIQLFDLAGADDRRFSPYCWRTRIALAHKGLDYEAVPARFIDIPAVADGKQKTVPVIVDGSRIIGDSWAIANYLEETYPDRPSLFGGDAAHALTQFFQSWAVGVLHPGIIGLILRDIYLRLDDADKPYFRASREKRFGRTIETVQEGRDGRIPDFRASLQPLRTVLTAQPWFGGEWPLYADYIVFGAFQWPRIASDAELLAADDPIALWFERCLDLYGGLGRRARSSAQN